MLAEQDRIASRHGVPPHARIAWVRRKFGGDVTVWRVLSDGRLGCSVPCVLCRRALVRRDLRVHAVLPDGAWFHGRLTDAGAPPSRATSGQVYRMGFVPRPTIRHGESNDL